MTEHETPTGAGRSRAKPMPPDERRRTIIRAARPLVAEYGARVTTAQIAAAAGIAEGTLFRVFATKADIIVAVIDDALDTSDIIAWVVEYAQASLAAQTREILVQLQTRYREASAMFAALYSLGQEGQDAARPRQHDLARAREDHLRLRDAIACSLARFDDELAVAPSKAASLLLGFATISSHGLVSDGSLTDPDELLDLFLHGTARKARP